MSQSRKQLNILIMSVFYGLLWNKPLSMFELIQDKVSNEGFRNKTNRSPLESVIQNNALKFKCLLCYHLSANNIPGQVFYSPAALQHSRSQLSS